jgi:hypothetical protein
MRLAIVVVCMVRDEHAPLLDVHFDRIARHTTATYTVHASIGTLPPTLRGRVRDRAHVRLHELTPTQLRGSAEHSYYLEQLVSRAVDDGATHVATLHVDSFPVRDGWAETLAQRLSGGVAFATTADINTACLFFTREFYLAHRPAFLVSAAERASPAFDAYVRAASPPDHSGIGYGFRAWQVGLSWHCMPASSVRRERAGAEIYDDLVFHLKGAVRLPTNVPNAMRSPLRTLGYRRFEALMQILRRRMPLRARRVVRAALSRPLAVLVDRPRAQWEAEGLVGDAARLLADPDGFVRSLRGRRS